MPNNIFSFSIVSNIIKKINKIVSFHQKSWLQFLSSFHWRNEMISFIRDYYGHSSDVIVASGQNLIWQLRMIGPGFRLILTEVEPNKTGKNPN